MIGTLHRAALPATSGSSRCPHCAKIFATPRARLWHRVRRRGPTHGRRCLSAAELLQRGWSQRAGAWSVAARAPIVAEILP